MAVNKPSLRKIIAHARGLSPRRGNRINTSRNVGRVLCTILSFAFLFVEAQDDVKRKPNIIFIMADDLGYETLACNGNDRNQTPNLDRLAAEGMRFTHAYATPLCTPTRVQLMTGKYNFRNYIGFGLLKPGEKTFADLLKKEGYVTGITGKWQLLGNERQRQLAGGMTGSRPEDTGFDQYCLWQVDQLGSRFKDPLIATNTGSKEYTGKYGPDVFTDFALDFIESNKDKPFFLYYPMVLTHDPFQHTPDNPGFDDFEVKKGLNDPAYFREMVEYMDKIVGKIADKVQDGGLRENTLIIFTGDNGTHKSVTSYFQGKEFRGDKGQTNILGTHVPMIANWSGVINPGQVNENLIDFTDFLPTFMEVAGAKIPSDFQTDGLSFFGQLLDKKTRAREWVYCSYAPNWGGRAPANWAHDRTWKLYDDDRFFNIATDPAEFQALPAGALSGDARKAKHKLKKALKIYQH